MSLIFRLGEKPMIERINVPDVIVVVALSAALIISIYGGLNELSMSIASGLLRYIGGAGKHSFEKKGEKYL